MKSKFGKKIGQLFADELEFPSDSFNNIPVVELKGNNEAYIIGCRSISEYDSQRIVFVMPSYKLTLSGEDLVLSDFMSGSVSVRGRIERISMSEENS